MIAHTFMCVCECRDRFPPYIDQMVAWSRCWNILLFHSSTCLFFHTLSLNHYSQTHFRLIEDKLWCALIVTQHFTAYVCNCLFWGIISFVSLTVLFYCLLPFSSCCFFFGRCLSDCFIVYYLIVLFWCLSIHFNPVAQCTAPMITRTRERKWGREREYLCDARTKWQESGWLVCFYSFLFSLEHLDLKVKCAPIHNRQWSHNFGNVIGKTTTIRWFRICNLAPCLSFSHSLFVNIYLYIYNIDGRLLQMIDRWLVCPFSSIDTRVSTWTRGRLSKQNTHIILAGWRFRLAVDSLFLSHSPVSVCFCWNVSGRGPYFAHYLSAIDVNVSICLLMPSSWMI